MRWTSIRKYMVYMLIISLIFSHVPRVYGEEQNHVIYISTKEELLEFAEQCRLDTWSIGKVIELTADIDLGGEPFSPIPIFNGIFDGKGHTISGLLIETSGSNQGLFRYVQSEGVIKDVIVEGNVIPSGTQDTVGGVVGSNAGTLQNVIFSGTVNGESLVGGLVGVNLEAGQILMSMTEGKILGEKMVGGIVGKNLGTVIGATNLAEVNTVVDKDTNSIEAVNFELEGTLEQLSGASNIEDSQQLLDRYTDIGGIAGYSSGMIQGATNKGKIGYPHVGYNVGGVAGRQNGYILGGSNEGSVYGRKDVGGIVGHAEPNITLSLSEDLLDRLETELEVLRQLVNTTLNDVDATSKETSDYLSNVSQYTSIATEHTQILFDETTEFVDENVEQVNQVSAIIANAIDKMIPIMDTVETSSEHMTQGIDALEKAFEALEEVTDESEEVSSHMEKAIKDLRDANNSVYDAMVSMQTSMQDFKEAVIVHDEHRLENALNQLAAEVEYLSQEAERVADAFETIRYILESISGTEDLIIQQEIILGYLTDLIISLEIMGELFIDIGSSITNISSNVTLDWGDMQEGIQELAIMLEELQAVSTHMDDVFGHLIDAFEPMENMTGALGEAMENMSSAMGHIEDGSKEITSAVEKIRELLIELSNEEPIVFKDLGEDYRATSDELYKSIEQISSELDGLNHAVTDNGKQLTAQISKINNQFNVIMKLLLEAVEQVTYVDETMNPLNNIEDFSNQSIEEITLGKVVDATNTGKIEADHNVGGIAGLMAIEYGLNQELDLDVPNSFNYTYQTRAVIQACKNEGEVVGKKDYTGGIVGRMYTGVVIDSENYGLVKSTNGNYVGGIAGGSEAIIHSSFSKNVLEGKNYIGGIVGIGKNVMNSYSIVQILSGEENIGAIAGGKIADAAQIQNNYFINESIGGIDAISYTNQAEPVSYEELLSHQDIPERFLSFNVTAMIDDAIHTQIPIEFGAGLETIELPQLPEREGHYSYWAPLENQNTVGDLRVEGVYKPWLTMIASEISEEDELSFVLVEGQFKEDAVVKVTERTDLVWKDSTEIGNVPVYHIQLQNAQVGEQEEIAIRLLNEQEDATIWVYKDNVWEKAKTQDAGKYSLTTMIGEEEIFCIVPKEKNTVLQIIGGLLGIGVVVFFGNKVLKRSKKSSEEIKEV